jgi:hypothetical protein
MCIHIQKIQKDDLLRCRRLFCNGSVVRYVLETPYVCAYGWDGNRHIRRWPPKHNTPRFHYKTIAYILTNRLVISFLICKHTARSVLWHVTLIQIAYDSPWRRCNMWGWLTRHWNVGYLETALLKASNKHLLLALTEAPNWRTLWRSTHASVRTAPQRTRKRNVTAPVRSSKCRFSRNSCLQLLRIRFSRNSCLRTPLIRFSRNSCLRTPLTWFSWNSCLLEVL